MKNTIQIERSPLVCSINENGEPYTLEEYNKALDNNLREIKQNYSRGSFEKFFYRKK